MVNSLIESPFELNAHISGSESPSAVSSRQWESTVNASDQDTELEGTIPITLAGWDCWLNIIFRIFWIPGETMGFNNEVNVRNKLKRSESLDLTLLTMAIGMSILDNSVIELSILFQNQY